MRDLMRILMASLVALVFVACGPDEEGDEPVEDTGMVDTGGESDVSDEDTGTDTGEDVDTDISTDVSDEDTGADTSEDTEPDTSDSGPDTGEADVVEDVVEDGTSNEDAVDSDVGGGDTAESGTSCDEDTGCLEGETCVCDDGECACVDAPPEGDPEPAPDAGDGG